MARKFRVDGPTSQPRKLTKDERAERVERGGAAASASSELLDRKPAALSGGQRQRVAWPGPS